jgi:hypothetical protein
MNMRHFSVSRVWMTATALVLGLAGMAQASSSPSQSAKVLMSYATSGAIDTNGVTGTPVVSFNSVPSGQFTTPSSFSLGEFMVAALPSGVTTTYADTPFSITYLVNSVDGKSVDPSTTPIVLTGKINGSVTGASQSDLMVSFDQKPIPEFLTNGYSNTLVNLDSNLTLVPSTTNGGRTTAQSLMVVSPVPVPEPASIMIFGLGAAGLVWHRRRRQTV